MKKCILVMLVALVLGAGADYTEDIERGHVLLDDWATMIHNAGVDFEDELSSEDALSVLRVLIPAEFKLLQAIEIYKSLLPALETDELTEDNLFWLGQLALRLDLSMSEQVKEPSWYSTGTYRVTRIVDGDTLDCAVIGRVRLLHIDTPERGEPGFQAAADRLSELVLDRHVVLVFLGESLRDSCNRLLAQVWVDVDGFALSAGQILQDEGLAVEWVDE